MNRNTLSRRRTIGARYARTSAEGGGGGTPAGDGSPAGGQSTTTAVGNAPVTVIPDGQQQAAEQQWDGKVESLPEPVQKMIRDLRTESAERRTKLTTAEQAQQDAIRALAKAAGIELPGDAQPDPQQVTQQLTETAAENRTLKVENAVLRSADKHGADAGALTDSRSFLAKLETLDPTAADFGAKVDAAIAEAVTANPKLKAGRAPGASGADHTGGAGEVPASKYRPGMSIADGLAADGT